MICPECDAENIEGAETCSGCGGPLATTPEEGSPESPGATATPTADSFANGGDVVAPEPEQVQVVSPPVASTLSIAPTHNVKVCPTCGARNSETLSLCTRCNDVLTDVAAAPPAAKEESHGAAAATVSTEPRAVKICPDCDQENPESAALCVNVQCAGTLVNVATVFIDPKTATPEVQPSSGATTCPHCGKAIHVSEFEFTCPECYETLASDGPQEGPTESCPGCQQSIAQDAERCEECGWLRNFVPEKGMNFLGLDYILIERVPKISTEGELWLAESPNPEAEGKRVIVKLYNQGIHPEGDIVERLQQVDHDHVVKVHRSNRLPDGRSFQILEYIQHGTLNEIWGDCRWPLSSADDEAPEIKAKRIKLVRELWKAIQGIQEMDLVHGDIKPENVMSRDTDWDLVLTDFGLSSVVEMSLHTASKGQTQAYSSPEALSGIVHKANDWWSMGIVLLEMLRGEHPLLLYISKSSQHRGELVKQLHEHGIEVPSDVDRDWEPLIKGLLTYNSEKRWGAEEVGRWLDGDREMPVHYQAGYGRAVKPIRFGDHDYYSPAQLARAMAERWGDGLVLHQSGQLLDWVLQDLENRHMAARLQTVPNKIKIETSSGHNDLLDDLRYSAVLLALEPKLPVMHRGAGSVGEEITERWLERHDRHIVDAVLDSGLPQVCEDWSGASWLKKAKERRDKVRPFLRQAKDAGIEFHEPGVQAVVFSDLDRVLEQSQTIRRRFSAVRESHPRLDEKEADLTPLQRKKIRKKRGEILTELLQTESLEIHHAVLLRLMATAGTDLFLITWQEHYFILDDSIEKQFNALQTELESFTPESAEYGPAQKRIAALRELLRDAGEQVGRLREAANESERDRFFPSADVLAAAIEARETVEVSLATGLINRIGKVVTKPDLSRTVIEQCEKELDDVAALLAGIEAPGDSGVQDPTAARKSKRLEEVEERLGEARDSVQIVLDQWTLLKRLETDIPKRRDSIATKGDDSGYDLSEDEIWSVRTGLSERPFSDIDWSVLTPLPRPSQFSAELVVAEDDPGMGKGIQSAPDNRAFAHVNLKVVEPFQGPELAFHPELGSSGWPADPADSRAQSPSWQDLKDKVLETGSNRFPHVAVWPYWKSTQDDKVVWRRAAAPFHLSLAFCEIRISRNWLLGGVKIKSKSGDLEGPFSLEYDSVERVRIDRLPRKGVKFSFRKLRLTRSQDLDSRKFALKPVSPDRFGIQRVELFEPREFRRLFKHLR